MSISGGMELRNARRTQLFLLVVALGVVASGCSKSKGPMLAGGKSVDHWVSALQDSNVKTREVAVTKLGNVGTADAAAIPALINALKDKNAQVRREAVLALAKVGPAARDAIGPLTEMQQHDQDAKVRDYAAKGVKRLQDGAGST